jgi:hypothetical protein
MPDLAELGRVRDQVRGSRASARPCPGASQEPEPVGPGSASLNRAMVELDDRAPAVPPVHAAVPPLANCIEIAILRFNDKSKMKKIN